MSNKILVVYEGKEREKDFINNIEVAFAEAENSSDIILIDLQMDFRGSIYQLYAALKDEEYSDVFDVLKQRLKDRRDTESRLLTIDRKEIAETYLFFDLDLQDSNSPVADNLKKVEEILSFFDNETEQGKLYISYPMAEALMDISQNNICDKQCYVFTKDFRSYSSIVASRADNDFLHKKIYRNRGIWDFLCLHAISKANCLINGMYEYCGYDTGKDFSQGVIFAKQKQAVLTKNYVYVLSGFPFFLLEYFGKKLWENLQLPKGYQLQVSKECHNK